jgi:hypothetical protein
MHTRVPSPGALLLAAACAAQPAPAPPAPQPAAAPAAAPAPAPAAAPAPAPAAATTVNLAGEWDFTVDAGGMTVAGEMSLQRSGPSYTGTVTPQGSTSATVRTVTITGQRIVMVIDTPDGEAVFEGTLDPDGRTMSGAVAFQGQVMGLTARKR